jgi:hypothetical protein
MKRKYDLFEMFPDGGVLWRGAIEGHENAVARLEDLSLHTTNELRVMFAETVISRANIPQPRLAMD